MVVEQSRGAIYEDKATGVDWRRTARTQASRPLPDLQLTIYGHTGLWTPSHPSPGNVISLVTTNTRTYWVFSKNLAPPPWAEGPKASPWLVIIGGQIPASYLYKPKLPYLDATLWAYFINHILILTFPFWWINKQVLDYSMTSPATSGIQVSGALFIIKSDA